MGTGKLLDANYRDIAARLLAMSRGGDAGGLRAHEWDAMQVIARHERLLGLAWHFGGDALRRTAPPSIVAAWRAEVMRDALRAESQLGSVAAYVALCRDAGIEAVILKGAPLAHRLYGDHRVRPSLDADIFVPAREREHSRRILEQLGWDHVGGSAPGEESFHLREQEHHLLMEVHSRMLDDPVLEHLRLPAPRYSRITIDGVELLAHDDDLLPGFLAAHLAKHDHAPLLWLNDFSLLWRSLTDARRAEAIRAARESGLGRHLDWAIARAAHLERAASGDQIALERLGYGARRRREVHTLVRLALLAASPAHAVQVVYGRLWPPHLRSDGRSFGRQAAERLFGRARRTLNRSGAERRSGPPTLRESTGGDWTGAGKVDAPARRALDVGREDFRELIAELLHRGGGTWIRARGGSMEPTIPNGALVHIAPVSNRVLRTGDVVLAVMPDGSFALHRILSASDGAVRMQGDAVGCPDRPIRLDAVLGIADLLEHAGRRRPIPESPGVARRYISFIVRRARSALPRVASALGNRAGRT